MGSSAICCSSCSKAETENRNTTNINVEEYSPIALAGVIKAQAMFRGLLSRQKIKKIYGFEVSEGLYDKMKIIEISESKLEQQRTEVQAMRDQLPDFMWDRTHQIDFEVKIEKRPPQTMPAYVVYDGEWNQITNERHGKGIQTWNDGSVYEGYWANNKANGRGRLIETDGSVYEGHWANDMKSGQGRYTHLDGSYYEGAWLNDK